MMGLYMTRQPRMKPGKTGAGPAAETRLRRDINGQMKPVTLAPMWCRVGSGGVR